MRPRRRSDGRRAEQIQLFNRRSRKRRAVSRSAISRASPAARKMIHRGDAGERVLRVAGHAEFEIGELIRLLPADARVAPIFRPASRHPESFVRNCDKHRIVSQCVFHGRPERKGL